LLCPSNHLESGISQPTTHLADTQVHTGISVRSWREAGEEPVPVAPSYTKFVNEHMFPTSGADLDSACAVDGVCGAATGMVCAAEQYCDELMGMCSHVSPAKRIIDAADALHTGAGPGE